MRRAALEASRSLLEIRPLFKTARLLSLNTELASSQGEGGEALIVVVRHLREMITRLRALIEDVEQTFRQVARCVGLWLTAEQQQRLYRLALDELRARRGASPVRWPAGHLGSPPRPPLSVEEERMWACIANTDQQIRGALKELTRGTRRLVMLMEQSEWITVLESGYLAIIAALEGGRWGSGGSIAASMREVSDALRAVQGQARVRVAALLDSTLALQVGAPRRGGGLRSAGIEEVRAGR